MSLGLFFFVSSIMGGDFTVPVSEAKKQIRHAEMFRNGFACASGVVLTPFVTLWASSLSPVVSVLIGGSVSALSGYCSYLLHAKAKTLSSEIKQPFHVNKSIAKIAFNYALGLGTCAAILLL